jgi:multidrug resistance protein MdtO
MTMAAVAQSAMQPPRSLGWFRGFLNEELAPYPGRDAVVARMVIASTVVMIVNMTFKVPYAAYGAIYALTISREDPRSTLSAVKTIIVAFAFAAADVLIGAMLFAGDPMLRFLWVVATLFTVFYALSALTNYTAAARFGYLVAITIPLWDQHIPTEVKVENTLWAVGSISIASLITAGIELVFAQLSPSDDLLRSLEERLNSVEELLRSYATGRPVEKKAEERVTRLAVVGASRLRRLLQRSAGSMNYHEQMGAVVSLVGRLVDLAASFTSLEVQLSDADRKRMQDLADQVADIRADLIAGKTPRRLANSENHDGVPSIPLLSEMERTVRLIPEVCAGSQVLSAYAPLPSEQGPRASLFVPDAFTNPDHIKFGLRGGLAASLCYCIYSALVWPEISTSITTCVLTALTTVGASRQKQVLRFTGALAGGTVGMAAQVFILPHIDSIAGFTLLFLPVTIVAAWIATSSSRLSYFGVQVAVAFDLINLSEFKFQTSLAIARDRVVGILLGLFMMWLVFDQLWVSTAGVQMRKTFIAALRALAQLAREPVSTNQRAAIERSYALRETINTSFNKVRALGDGVLFEFGPSRQQDLALRSQITGWQPQLRTLYVTRVALLKYRLQLPGFELPEPVRLAHREFDECLARELDGMADQLDGKVPMEMESLAASLARLEATAATFNSTETQGVLSARLQTFLPLLRRIENLAISLDKEILASMDHA